MLLLAGSAFSQFATCDSNLANAVLNPAGYRRVFVPTQPCSMYYFSSTAKYGTDAHRDAINLGVPQLIVDNAQENADVQSAFFSQGVFSVPSSGAAVWLGITDSSTIYNWRVYSTGATPTYYNWASGDPNNLRPGCYNGVTGCAFCTGADAYWCAHGEDCAIMSAGGQWLDNSCQGANVRRVVVLEINTCPVLVKPRDTTICAGRPVTLSTAVASGGTAPFSYTWTPGGQTGTSITVTPSALTTYTVALSDRFHCVADTTVTVSVNTPTAPTIATPATICKNANTNVSLSTISGTATYAWSFGAGSSAMSGTGGGPYTVQWSTGGSKTISVTVTDLGCSTTATKTITVDSADAGFALNPITACTGQNVTATVNTVSPTATYSWSFGGGTGTNSGSPAGPYTITWPTSGTKTVGLTVTDHGCTGNSSSTLNITAAPTPTFTLSPSGTVCQGELVSITLGGPASGTAIYAWNFHGGTVLSGSGAGPYSVSWSTPGPQNVDLSVTDGGCTGTAVTQSITISAGIAAAAGADIQICPGVAGQLGATPTAGYTYSWSPVIGLSNPAIANPTVSIPVNPTGANIDTFYVLTATSGSCVARDTVRVTLYATPTGTFTINPTTTCQNSNVTITYTGSASASAVYNWNFDGGNIVSGSGQGPYTVTWATTGTKNVDLTVTENGCPSAPATNAVTISNSMSVAFTLSPATTACIGEPVAVTLTGAASGTATYTWNFDGGTVLSGSGAGPYSISWGTNGTRNIDLTVTDGGCSGTAATQSITIANSAAANAGADIQLCPGVAGTLGAPATGSYTYSWSPAWGLSSTTVADPAITIPSNPTGAIIDTFYVLTATSGTCVAVDTVLVRIYPDIDNSFVVSASTVCAGQNMTVTYAGIVSATATYTWNFGAATIVSGSGAGPYTIFWPSSGSQTISLNVTDNGCSAATPGSTTITVSAQPVANAGTSQTVCSGVQVQLGAPAVPGEAYTWTPATNLSSATVADPTFSQTNTSGAAVTTTYMLIASAGCADTAYVTLTVTPVAPMSILLSGPAAFCQGDSVVLSDDLAPQADYLWSTNETTATITVRTSGTYTLTAHDANNCEYISSAAVVVTVNPKPVISLAPNGQLDESCLGLNDGSLTVQVSNGTPNYSYNWNTLPAQNSATAAGLAPGTYRVLVADANGCMDSASFTVNSAPYFGLLIDSTTELTCNDQTHGAIYASVTGGNLPVSYLWSTTAVTPAITNLSAGTYSVTATDVRGCAADTSIAIAPAVRVTFTTTSPLLISYGGSEQIEITISPAANYIYSWTPGTGLSCTACPSPMASPLQTTTYILTVVDPIGGCTGIDTITLFVDPSKRFYVPNAFTPNGDGINDLFQAYASGPVRFFELTIFDRWGEKIYDSNDIGAGWDGRYHGVYASNGEYVYQVSITFLDGQTLANRGSITLLK